LLSQLSPAGLVLRPFDHVAAPMPLCILSGRPKTSELRENLEALQFSSYPRDSAWRTCDSSDLTAEQARIVRDRLQPLVIVLHKWQHRMLQTGFPTGDPLLRSTVDAYESAAELTIRFHRIVDTSKIVMSPKPDRRRRAPHRRPAKPPEL
jgi:hypothetical protein